MSPDYSMLFFTPTGSPDNPAVALAIIVVVSLVMLSQFGPVQRWFRRFRQRRTARALAKAADHLGLDWNQPHETSDGVGTGRLQRRPISVETTFSEGEIQSPKPVCRISVRLGAPWRTLELWLPDSIYARPNEGTVLAEAAGGDLRLAGDADPDLRSRLENPELIEQLLEMRAAVDDLKIGPELLEVELAGITDFEIFVKAARQATELADRLDEAAAPDQSFFIEFGDDDQRDDRHDETEPARAARRRD